MSADTSTIVVDRPDVAEHLGVHRGDLLPPAMSVTNIRVRTTSASDAPASCSAISMRRNASRACAAMSVAGCGGARDDDERADAHGAGVADPVLERGPRPDGDPVLTHGVNDIRVQAVIRPLPRGEVATRRFVLGVLRAT